MKSQPQAKIFADFGKLPSEPQKALYNSFHRLLCTPRDEEDKVENVKNLHIAAFCYICYIPLYFLEVSLGGSVNLFGSDLMFG